MLLADEAHDFKLFLSTLEPHGIFPQVVLQSTDPNTLSWVLTNLALECVLFWKTKCKLSLRVECSNEFYSLIHEN